VSHPHVDFGGGGSKRTSEGTSHAARRTSVDEAPGPSSTPQGVVVGALLKVKLHKFYQTLPELFHLV
jgi:hypothetical protein